jgi:hypothetical protein
LAYPEGFDEPVVATVLKETLKALPVDFLHIQFFLKREEIK